MHRCRNIYCKWNKWKKEIYVGVILSYNAHWAEQSVQSQQFTSKGVNNSSTLKDLQIMFGDDSPSSSSRELHFQDLLSPLFLLLEWCWCSEDNPAMADTIEWKAVTAILDLICPLLGKGLPLNCFPIAAAVPLLLILLFIFFSGIRVLDVSKSKVEERVSGSVFYISTGA